LFFVAGGEGVGLACGEVGEEEGGGGDVPGVHGADAVRGDDLEGLAFDLVLRGGDDRDRAVRGGVGLPDVEQLVLVAAFGAGGADEGAGDFDAGPGAGDDQDFGVAQELQGFGVAALVGQVRAGRDEYGGYIGQRRRGTTLVTAPSLAASRDAQQRGSKRSRQRRTV
jgi:hypothetical protein